MKKKINANVYRKAAELIEKTNFVCPAINKIVKKDLYVEDNIYLQKLYLLYEPEYTKYNGYPFFSYTENNMEDNEFSSFGKYGNLRRELALLFLAEMIETNSI